MVLPGHNKQVEAMKKAGVDSGWLLTSVRVENERMPKQIVLLPLIVIIVLLGWNQTRRRKKEERLAAQ